MTMTITMTMAANERLRVMQAMYNVAGGKLTGSGQGGRAGTAAFYERFVAIGLVVAGIILPPLLSFLFSSIWLPLAGATGLALAAAGLALYVAWGQRETSRLTAAMIADLRRLADSGERSAVQANAARMDIAALEKAGASERRNLGLVAGGLGEMRQLLDLERHNLGLVANSIGELRGALASFHETLQEARVEVRQLCERLDGVEARTKAVAAGQLSLQGEVRAERRNLGMVAGALDDLRRSTAGVERFDARQAAFEDELVRIADRLDGLGVDGDLPAGSNEGSTAAKQSLPEEAA